jgi:hypothetical protein
MDNNYVISWAAKKFFEFNAVTFRDAKNETALTGHLSRLILSPFS